jgi:ankyrin repeat protein
MMCKFESCNLNPVDGFGDTPLDNARMTNQRAVAAMLEDAGGISGSDSSLAAEAAEVQEYIRNMANTSKAIRLQELLATLPEAKAVQDSLMVVDTQKQFVQVRWCQ